MYLLCFWVHKIFNLTNYSRICNLFLQIWENWLKWEIIIIINNNNKSVKIIFLSFIWKLEVKTNLTHQKLLKSDLI